MGDFAVKLMLTALVVIVGSASLPFTGGFSGVVMIGVILAIWGYDDANPT